MAGKHENSKNRGVRKLKKRSARKKALIAALAVIGIAAVLVVVAGAVSGGVKDIYPNVSVNGVKVGGMTLTQAETAFDRAGFSAEANNAVSVRLSDDADIRITAEQAGLAVSSVDAAKLAYDYGRSSGFVGRAFRYIGCLLGASNIDAVSKGGFDEASVRSIIAEGANAANSELLKNVFKIGRTNILVTKGSVGIVIDQDEVYELVREAFDKKNYSVIEYDAEKNVPEEISFQTIYNQVFIEPVAAVYDPKTSEISQSVTGVSFDIAAAQRMYSEAKNGETISIPLIFTEPSVTTEQLGAMLFRDTLASKTTSLATSSSNRTNNISLAASAVNGTVLNPGETFSFNGTVGERTSAKGYKPAGAYVGGENVDQIGGGICQCSSTIYYCVLLANLKVVERSNHMYPVSYLPMGLDATVNWGTLDFKFENNTDYPIKINAAVSGRELTVELIGTKLDDTYVKLDNAVISSTPPETVEELDETLEPGTEEVKTSGHTGYVVDAYKYIYAGDGTLIEKVYLGRDKYRVQNKVVRVGPPLPEDPVVDPVEDPDPWADPDPNPNPDPNPDPNPNPYPDPNPDPNPNPDPDPGV